MLINKDNFGITGGFLVGWKFDFWIVKWLKVAWLVVLSDMGYDKWFEMGKLGFCLILLGIYEGWIFELVCGRISYSSKLKSKHLFEFLIHFIILAKLKIVYFVESH